MARAGSRNQHQRHGRILRQGFQAAQSLQRQERQAEIPPLCDLISAEECLAMKALTRPENGLSLESRSEKDLVQVRFRRCSSLSVSGSDHPVYVSNRLITFGSTATSGFGAHPGWLSSGGDAALVAMGCVPMAACSDVAGSIRIPASRFAVS
jgi:hypothetical protein